jgi:hypothetical protein
VRVTAAECKGQQYAWQNEYFKLEKFLRSTKFEVLSQIKGRGGHCDYSLGAPKKYLNTQLENSVLFE